MKTNNAILPKLDIALSFIIRPLDWQLSYEIQREFGLAVFIRFGPFWLGCSFLARPRRYPSLGQSFDRNSNGQ